jgi:multidrug efflux system membrane fusion protein
MRAVKIARQDEKQAVIAEGVKPGDTLVVNGFGRLKDGATVAVSDGKTPPASADAPAKQRHRQGGKATRDTSDRQQSSASQSGAPLITGSNTEPTRTVDNSKPGAQPDQQRRGNAKDGGTSP